MSHYYKVNIDWKNGRKGEISSPELEMKIDVATPPQFHKGIEGVWSPEHLFTAAINSCLMTTFLSIAENSRLDFLHFSSAASGKLSVVDKKYMMTEVTLCPVVTIADESKRALAERVLYKSKENCLISDSVRSEIIFKPEVKVAGISITT